LAKKSKRRNNRGFHFLVSPQKRLSACWQKTKNPDNDRDYRWEKSLIFPRLESEILKTRLRCASSQTV
jgi:hypothetical protein